MTCFFCSSAPPRVQTTKLLCLTYDLCIKQETKQTKTLLCLQQLHIDRCRLIGVISLINRHVSTAVTMASTYRMDVYVLSVSTLLQTVTDTKMHLRGPRLWSKVALFILLKWWINSKCYRKHCSLLDLPRNIFVCLSLAVTRSAGSFICACHSFSALYLWLSVDGGNEAESHAHISRWTMKSLKDTSHWCLLLLVLPS